MSRDLSWGVVRYAPNMGPAPDDDPCVFDGWYSSKHMAKSVYHDWCQRFPGWIVSMVMMHEGRFPKPGQHARREAQPFPPIRKRDRNL